MAFNFSKIRIARAAEQPLAYMPKKSPPKSSASVRIEAAKACLLLSQRPSIQ